MPSPTLLLPLAKSPDSATTQRKAMRRSVVKTLVRYSHRTCDMLGMLVKPTGTLKLDCYVNADFAQAFMAVILIILRPPRSLKLVTSSLLVDVLFCGNLILFKVRSRCPHSRPQIIRSQLCNAYALAPLLQEIASGIKLPRTFTSTTKCQVFEDNNSVCLLAVNQHITNRS